MILSSNSYFKCNLIEVLVLTLGPESMHVVKFLNLGPMCVCVCVCVCVIIQVYNLIDPSLAMMVLNVGPNLCST